MPDRLTRRTFAKTLAAPALLPLMQSKRLQIGCTALIWGALPRAPENFAVAVKDMAELGYHKCETFASIVYDMDHKGTLAPLLDQHRLPLVSAYATVQLTDTSQRKDTLAQLIEWGKALKKHGGQIMVLAPNGVKREAYTFAEHRANIVSGLNDYAKAMNDVGLAAGLHQHTNTAVESRDETYATMEAVDTRYCKFAPDVGQLQKGGADAARVIRDFASITITLHLKDFKGWEHFAGYCPLGEGNVDLKAVLDTMEAQTHTANIMHELDGSTNPPYTPRRTAEISKTYLQKLGYRFRAV